MAVTDARLVGFSEIKVNSIAVEHRQVGIAVTEAIGSSPGQLKFETLVKPTVQQTCQLEIDWYERDGTTAVDLNHRPFEGLITRYNEIEVDEAGRLWYAVTALDHRWGINRRNINFIEDEQSWSSILTALMTAIQGVTSGFTLGAFDSPGYNVGPFDYEDVKPLDIIDRLANEAGMFWDITNSKQLRFWNAGSVTYEYGVVLNRTTGGFKAMGVEKDMTGLANSIIVKGKADEDGVQPEVTKTDGTSISTYGQHDAPNLDASPIENEAILGEIGQDYIDARKDPVDRCQLATSRHGFITGGSFKVTDADRGLSGKEFFITNQVLECMSRGDARFWQTTLAGTTESKLELAALTLERFRSRIDDDDDDKGGPGDGEEDDIDEIDPGSESADELHFYIQYNRNTGVIRLRASNKYGEAMKVTIRMTLRTQEGVTYGLANSGANSTSQSGTTKNTKIEGNWTIPATSNEVLTITFGAVLTKKGQAKLTISNRRLVTSKTRPPIDSIMFGKSKMLSGFTPAQRVVRSFNMLAGIKAIAMPGFGDNMVDDGSHAGDVWDDDPGSSPVKYKTTNRKKMRDRILRRLLKDNRHFDGTNERTPAEQIDRADRSNRDLLGIGDVDGGLKDARKLGTGGMRSRSDGLGTAATLATDGSGRHRNKIHDGTNERTMTQVRDRGDRSDAVNNTAGDGLKDSRKFGTGGLQTRSDGMGTAAVQSQDGSGRRRHSIFDGANERTMTQVRDRGDRSNLLADSTGAGLAASRNLGTTPRANGGLYDTGGTVQVLDNSGRTRGSSFDGTLARTKLQQIDRANRADGVLATGGDGVKINMNLGTGGMRSRGDGIGSSGQLGMDGSARNRYQLFDGSLGRSMANQINRADRANALADATGAGLAASRNLGTTPRANGGIYNTAGTVEALDSSARMRGDSFDGTTQRTKLQQITRADQADAVLNAQLGLKNAMDLGSGGMETRSDGIGTAAVQAVDGSARFRNSLYDGANVRTMAQQITRGDQADAALTATGNIKTGTKMGDSGLTAANVDTYSNKANDGLASGGTLRTTIDHPAAAIQISGATKLNDWRSTGALAKIEGGDVRTKTIGATQLADEAVHGVKLVDGLVNEFIAMGSTKTPSQWDDIVV